VRRGLLAGEFKFERSLAAEAAGARWPIPACRAAWTVARLQCGDDDQAIARTKVAGRRGGRRRGWELLLISVAAFPARGTDGTVPPRTSGRGFGRPAVWCGDRNSTVTIGSAHCRTRRWAAARVVGPKRGLRNCTTTGTHGDRHIRDGVFTAGTFRPYWQQPLLVSVRECRWHVYGTLEVTSRVDNGSSTEVPAHRARASALTANAFRLESYGDGLSATAYAFFIEDIDRALFDGYPISSTTPEVAAREAVRRLYRVFPDAFRPRPRGALDADLRAPDSGRSRRCPCA